MAAGWTYSDWIIKAAGSTDRLDRLRLHIKEVSDFISTGSFNVQGKSKSKGEVEQYLQTLLKREESEVAATGGASDISTTFVRGVPTRPGDGNA